MDKLLPPPNGSPEEIEAWNAMMDTMVTFIKASTNLMNTITNKVKPSARGAGGGRGSRVAELMGGCEPECEACQPKPPCGICGKDAKGATPASPALKSASRVPSVKVQPVAPVAVEPAEAPEPAGETDPESPEAPSDNPEAPTTAVSDDTLKASSQEAAPVASSNSPGLVAEAPPAALQGGGDKKCTCAAIRAQRLADEKKDRCSCSRKGRRKQIEEPIEEEEEEDADDVELMCGCGSTEGNTDAIMKDMVEKLANAQQEIAKLQEEMARLYRMDASKRIGPHGGPNPAALYREIMKDSDVPAQRPVRQRPFQMDSPLCIPCDDPNGRNTPNSYGRGPPDMNSAPRTMMRPPAMQQQYSSQGRSSPSQYYTPPQPPCRRPPQSLASPEMPMYGRSYDPGPESSPNYWSRLGEYGSPSPPSQRQMVVCPSLKTPPPEASSRRMVVCGPPSSRSPHDGCDPNNCRLQGD